MTTTKTRRLGRLAILAATAALVLPACGGDAEQESASARVQTVPLEAPKRDAGPRATPNDRGAEPMTPGEYRSSVFEPPVTFRISDRRWQRDSESEDVMSIFDYGGTQFDPDGSIIDVIRPWGVFDPRNPDNPDGRKWPKDILRWLREESGLRTTRPKEAEVAGLPAQMVEAEVVRSRGASCAPDTKCVDLFISSQATTLGLEDTQIARFYVLDAGDEERVLMLTVPRGKGRKAFGPLERIVRTMEFGA